MSSADNTYSRLVRWLKVLLPLTAVAILSTLFLVAETLDPEDAIPYAEVDVARILREQGVTRPRFGGTTADGARLVLEAEAIRPVGDTLSLFRGTSLTAAIDLPEGAHIDIESREGRVDSAAREVTLEGDARLVTSTGYTVETERLTAGFDTFRAEAEGGVKGRGPPGEITAGAMVLERRSADGGYLLVFKDGVRLIYRPQP